MCSKSMQRKTMDIEQKNCLKTTKQDSLPTVILTGFGPFRNIQVNSSWIAVQEVAKMGIDDIRLIIKEIPVEYGTVAKVIPELWKEFKPKLVVHCGVSSLADTLVLEQLAHNNGYQCVDVQGNLPPGNCCVKCGFDCIRSKIDMHQVSHDVNSSGIGVPAVVSHDAGRYLCEFTYYTSLRMNGYTAFIHVPPLDEPFSAKQLAQAIHVAVTSMLRQLAIISSQDYMSNSMYA